MVTFLTLFLGLTVGPNAVEVVVDQRVTAVEIRLDGAVVGRLEESPWRLECDFGPSLLPHRLEAVAFDEQGRELTRVEQGVNLPRPAAEATLALTDYSDGRYHGALLTWRTFDEADPIEVMFSFDGEELDVTAEGRVEIPDHDPQRIHILSAELVFEDEIRARAELAFGGQYGEAVSTELTAVAVALSNGKRLPTVASLRGWFLVEGKEARVVAVEKGRSEVLAVRDRSSFEKLGDIGREAFHQAGYGHRGASSSLYLRGGLEKRDVLRYVLTSPRSVPSEAGTVTKVFPVTGNYNYHRRGGIAFALSSPHPEESALRSEQWLASAVALAGLKAAATNCARAVLLVLGDEPVDHSTLGPETVREFLRVLRVPLLVWRVGEGTTSLPVWGEGQSITRLKDLNRSVKSVESVLEPQIIVWLDGYFLPQKIELAAAAKGTLEFSGGF